MDNTDIVLIVFLILGWCLFFTVVCAICTCVLAFVVIVGVNAFRYSRRKKFAEYNAPN